MNKEDLIKFFKQNLTVIKSYGVISLALFGLFVGWARFSMVKLV